MVQLRGRDSTSSNCTPTSGLHSDCDSSVDLVLKSDRISSVCESCRNRSLNLGFFHDDWWKSLNSS